MIEKNSKNSILCKSAIEILRSFNKTQLKNFQSFLAADFFGISADVKKLFKLIHPKLDDENFVGFKRTTLKSLFERNENDTPILLSAKTPMNLTKALERFLIIKKLDQEDFTKNHLLLKSYSEQGLPELLKKTAKKTVTQLGKNKVYDHSYHLHNFLLQETIYLDPNTDKHHFEIDSQYKMFDHLDSFFCMTKLRLGIEMHLRKNFINEDKPLFALNESLRFGEKQTSFYFQFYTQLLQLVQDKTYQENQFVLTKNIFKNNLTAWSHTDQRILIQFLINYITSFLNQGNREVLPLQLSLFQFGLKHGILLDHKKIMTYATFSNILTTHLACKKFKESHLFVEQYNKYLNPSIQKNAVQFAKGYIAMAQKDFVAAIENLSLVDQKSAISKLQVNCFLLRSSLEQYLIDPTFKQFLTSMINRFQHYVRKNKLNAQNRNIGFQNLSLTIKKFYQIIEYSTSKQQEKLSMTAFLTNVNDDPNPIMMKPWLIQKIQERLK